MSHLPLCIYYVEDRGRGSCSGHSQIVHKVFFSLKNCPNLPACYPELYICLFPLINLISSQSYFSKLQVAYCSCLFKPLCQKECPPSFPVSSFLIQCCTLNPFYLPPISFLFSPFLLKPLQSLFSNLISLCVCKDGEHFELCAVVFNFPVSHLFWFSSIFTSCPPSPSFFLSFLSYRSFLPPFSLPFFPTAPPPPCFFLLFPLTDSCDGDLELSMVRHQPEGLDQLQAQTKFTRKELQSLYRGFKNVWKPQTLTLRSQEWLIVWISCQGVLIWKDELAFLLISFDMTAQQLVAVLILSVVVVTPWAVSTQRLEIVGPKFQLTV